MNSRLYILFLDARQVDDLLAVQALARTLAKAGRTLPAMLIVHGSGENAERLLEGEGSIVERKNGQMVVRSAREAGLVEQAIRESNRKLVNVMTDNLVHAVGLHGSDRGLLRRGVGGEIQAGAVEWVEELAWKGAIPVISSLIHGDDGYSEADPAEVMRVLAAHLQKSDVNVVLFRSASFSGSGSLPPTSDKVSLEALKSLTIMEIVRPMVEAGMLVQISDMNSFIEGSEVKGMQVVT